MLFLIYRILTERDFWEYNLRNLHKKGQKDEVCTNWLWEDFT